MSYTPKIDKLLSVATELGFDAQDFADLALAAADQSGADLGEQARIASVLGIQTWKARQESHQGSSIYPPGWPRCPSCGDYALDGHVMCGSVGCGEADHR